MGFSCVAISTPCSASAHVLSSFWGLCSAPAYLSQAAVWGGGQSCLPTCPTLLPSPRCPHSWGMCSLPAYRVLYRVNKHPPHARNSSGTGDTMTKTVTTSALIELTFYWEEQRVYTATRKTCRKLGDDKGQWGSGIRSHSTRRASNFKWVIREGFTEQLKKLGNASQTVS